MADGFDINTSGINIHADLEAMPASVRRSLIAAITSLITVMAGRIISKSPTKSGKLRESIRPQIYTDNPTRVAGYVSVRGNKGKAVVLDKGSHKAVEVRGHQAKLDHAWGNALLSPTTVFVEAYTRHLNLTPTLFVTEPAQDMSSEVKAEIEMAIERGAQETMR